MTRTNKPSNAILQQAAEWYAALRDGEASEQQRAEWQQWLDESELHLAAWQSIEAISRQFEPLQRAPTAEHIVDTVEQANKRLQRRRRLLTGLIVITAGGVAGGLSWRHTSLPFTIMALRADYKTAVGEQRDILLPDGSRLWLNTASAVDMDFSQDLRRLMLWSGEIFIETAPAERPFVVDTRHGRLRVLGTRFNVLLMPDATRLAVYAGAVRVSPADLQQGRVIQAGQQARFSADKIDAAAPADMAREAWTRGLLVAQDITLHELVAELRRYRRGRITLADDIADLKVYGNFPARDSDRALAMLSTVLPVKVEHTMPGWVNIKPRRGR